MLRDEAAAEDLEEHRTLLTVKSQNLVDADSARSKGEDDVNNHAKERKKAFEEALRWSREQYETWIEAVGTRREQVDSQLKTSLEQLFQRRVDAIRPLDSKMASVDDEREKFEEEDRLDGDRVDRLRVKGEEELAKFDAFEKKREKLLESYETQRYLSVKATHLKEESRLAELKDKLAKKSHERDDELAKWKDESEMLKQLVSDERRRLRERAEQTWKKVQDEVDKENEQLRKDLKECQDTVKQCERDAERLLREQEEDLEPLRQQIKETQEKEKSDVETHEKKLEAAKEEKEEEKKKRDDEVDLLAKFEEDSEKEKLEREDDISVSGKKIDQLTEEKHTAVTQKYFVMREEFKRMEKEELGGIAVEKRACELTCKELEAFHAHETTRIDDLMTIVEDFEELVGICKKSSDNEREQIEREWKSALEINDQEQKDIEEKMRLKTEGLKKAELAARKALQQELGRLDQTVSHAKAEHASKRVLVEKEIAMRRQEIDSIDAEMHKLEEKESERGQRKAAFLTDMQVQFLRPRTTDQIMSQMNSPTKKPIPPPLSEISMNRGPVNAEHHAASDLCTKLKTFYEQNAALGNAPPSPLPTPQGGEGVQQPSVVPGGGLDLAGPKLEEESVDDEGDGLSFTREIERLSEADALTKEIDLIGESPATLNDCLNQGGRFSELSRRKLRLLVEIRAKEEELAVDAEHVSRVAKRIARQKQLRQDALDEMLSIQLEELEDEKEVKLRMVEQRRDKLRSTRRAYISKYSKCADKLDKLSNECLPSLEHLRKYSNQISSGMSGAEKEALQDLRRVEILERETAEHFASKRDELVIMERRDHEQCERDMTPAREHLAIKRADLENFNQRVIEQRAAKQESIEALKKVIEKMGESIDQLVQDREKQAQQSLDLIASLQSKVNNVYNIRREQMRENDAIKEEKEKMLPFLNNNLSANEERILSEQEQFEKKTRDAEVHREDDLLQLKLKGEEIDDNWEAFTKQFEKDCDEARDVAHKEIANAQEVYDTSCNSGVIKKLVADAKDAKEMSERYRSDSAKAAQTREHRRVLQHERWRRFLEACEQEKTSLIDEMDSEEQSLKKDYDLLFADLAEEEEAAAQELEVNERVAKEENHLRFKEERELEQLVAKLSEAAREAKNAKHQQERIIAEKEKALEIIREDRDAAEKTNSENELDLKRCSNLLERLEQRVIKEVAAHNELLRKEREELESLRAVEREAMRLLHTSKHAKMREEHEQVELNMAKELEEFTEKRRLKLEGDRLELIEEVNRAREDLEKDLDQVERDSKQRGRDRDKEVEMAVERRKLERENNQRKFNEVELKYDAFLDNSIADCEAYFDLLGERIEEHGENVLKQTKLERKRAETFLKNRMNKQLEDGQKKVQMQLEENRRMMQEETQKLIAQAEEDLWIRLKEERSSRLALIDQKRSQMKKQMEEEYISAQVKIREDLAQAERDKIDNVLSIFGPDTTKRGELALQLEAEKQPGKVPKVVDEKEAFEKERKELIKEMAIMDLELQELEYEQ